MNIGVSWCFAKVEQLGLRNELNILDYTANCSFHLKLHTLSKCHIGDVVEDV